ncbi:MAG: hypothetical protein J6R85_02910 [Lentisphaeria bacterium]|nr:hypothetical protein [Lentisphaeria bacterium]
MLLKSIVVLALFAGICSLGAADLTVTDFFKNDGKSDVSDAIQKIINENPNRTIYFPDGVYMLSKPIVTPADPQKSVSLKLAEYAVLKAAENWTSAEAVVRLGGSDPAHDITQIGANYSFAGGYIDGSGVANGIAIESGRETVIRNTSIKNTRIGVHIKRDPQYGSSDADIHQVNVYGTGAPDSIGVWVQGADNTISNMRIGNVHIGVRVDSGGNSMRDLHPLYIHKRTIPDEQFRSSIGFLDRSGANWYDYCYSDQFATGFVTTTNAASHFSRCFCYWYSSRGGTETAFRAEKRFNSVVSDLRVDFRKDTRNIFLRVGESGGKGELRNPVFRQERTEDAGYQSYLKGNIMPL